jgi:MFS family permease
MAGATLVDRMGRRRLWLTSTIIMLVSYSCLIGLSAGFASTKQKSLGLATVRPLLSQQPY